MIITAPEHRRRSRGQWLALGVAICLLIALALAATVVFVVRSSRTVGFPCSVRPAEVAARNESGACAATVRGDLDGDGSEDSLVVYLRPHGTTAHLRAWAVLATGQQEIDIGPAFGFAQEGSVLHAAPPQIAAFTDLDGDGGKEALIVTNQGANSISYRILAVDAARLVTVGVVAPHGLKAPFELVGGGAVSHGTGYDCRDLDADGKPELVTMSYIGDYGTPTEWSWSEVEYKWQSKALVKVRERSGVGHDEWQRDDSGMRKYAERAFAGCGRAPSRVDPNAGE
jgi:hypothetical protein